MKIALGADHAGFQLKDAIQKHLLNRGCEVDDQGTNSDSSVDYPDFARAVAERVASREADFGILVCGTGIGMAMAANKVQGVRAAKVNNETEAELSREHNDANVLTLGARILDEPTALRIVDRWLATAFSGGERHQHRIDKISEIESVLNSPEPASSATLKS